MVASCGTSKNVVRCVRMRPQNLFRGMEALSERAGAGRPRRGTMLHRTRWFRRFVRFSLAGRSSKPRAGRYRPKIEQLEERCVPATIYTVNSLLDASVGVGNAGTLRYVMNLANGNNTGTAASPDLIRFATGAGTSSVGSVTGIPLPALTD